jgi:hypothetical protein
LRSWGRWSVPNCAIGFASHRPQIGGSGARTGSERTDRLHKAGAYARLGIPRYWIAERTPRLAAQVLTLADGGYTAVPAVIEGTLLEAVIDADKPFTVSFDPANLLHC